MEGLPKRVADIPELEEIEVLEIIKDITDLRAKVLRYYDKFLTDVSNKRIKLEDSRRYQLFLLEADELEQWLNQKLQEKREFPSLKNRVQEHRAFETVINNHAKIVQPDEEIQEVHNLGFIADESSFVLKEATQLRSYNAAVKDIDFWLGEVESLLKPEDTGNDLAFVQHLTKQLQLIEADIKAYGERIKDMNNLADSLRQSGQFDSDSVQSKRQSINERYERLANLAKYRRNRLNEASTLHQFLRDMVDEESWIKEKKLLVASDDYGRDLAGVQDLRKKNKRLEADLAGHGPVIKAVQDAGQRLMVESSVGAPEIEQRLQNLEQNWLELQDMSNVRSQKLAESEDYQKFLSKVDEEEAWIREKRQTLVGPDLSDTMAAVQGLLKKHDVLETEFQNHQERLADLNAEGKKLIEQGNHHRDGIQDRLNLLRDRSNDLQENSKLRKSSLTLIYNTLQSMWRADVVDSWISDKAKELQSDDVGHDHVGPVTKRPKARPTPYSKLILLTNDRRNRKKKSISWQPDEKIQEVHYFESIADESVNVTRVNNLNRRRRDPIIFQRFFGV